MYFMNKEILIFIISITIGLTYDYYLDIGDLCTVESTGSPGECKILTDCTKAMKDLDDKNVHPQICGFRGTQSIICCPKKPGDISKKKCKEYSKYIWVLEESPIFIRHASKYKRRECGHEVTKFIAGGLPAEKTEFPHMVAIGYEEDSGKITFNCGGTLISDQFVLTAAHCLHNPLIKKNASHVQIGTVELDDSRNSQHFRVAKWFPYPDYKYPSNYHDIALIRLDRPVNMNPSARPACLYTKPKIFTKKCIATGWGAIAPQEFSLSNHLLKVTLDLVPQAECMAYYKTASVRHLRSGILGKIQICAGGAKKDTCKGDSGGPLQIYHTGDDIECMYDIVGITSVGSGCGSRAGVYVRVSNYIKWIEDIVWPEDSV